LGGWVVGFARWGCVFAGAVKIRLTKPRWDWNLG
jgi:hypothetical protein